MHKRLQEGVQARGARQGKGEFAGELPLAGAGAHAARGHPFGSPMERWHADYSKYLEQYPDPDPERQKWFKQNHARFKSLSFKHQSQHLLFKELLKQIAGMGDSAASQKLRVLEDTGQGGASKISRLYRELDRFLEFAQALGGWDVEEGIRQITLDSPIEAVRVWAEWKGEVNRMKESGSLPAAVAHYFLKRGFPFEKE
ncbi:MAG: hypothetical protein WC717_05445 [Candidatus Micrarchaeia archaeon]|jgi:hypothetical protein